MFFYQLFTIHVNGHYIGILLVFFLLPNKTIDKHVLSLNFSKIKLNLNLNLNKIVADFEENIFAGVKLIWPSIKVIGCRFHLTQCW